MLKIKTFLILLICFAGCGKHDSTSYGFTNSKAAKEGVASTTPDDFLRDAITQGIDDQFFKLLEDGIDINLLYNDGRTPLILSVVNGRTLYVYKLLQLGAKTEIKDASGKNAMDYAVENEHMRIQLFLNPDKQIQQQNDLFTAVTNGATGSVNELLNAGGNPNVINENGQTALTQALVNKKLLVAITIINWKDPGYEITPTDVNLPNSKGEKPLTLAKALEVTKPADIKNKDKVINALISNGATEEGPL